MPAVYGRAAVQPDTETAFRSRAGNYWPTRDLRGSLLKGPLTKHPRGNTAAKDGVGAVCGM